MIQKQTITDFYNRIIGFIETDTVTKEKTAKDFYNRKLGSYDPKTDITRDFYNRILGRGDMLSSLIYQENEKNRKK